VLSCALEPLNGGELGLILGPVLGSTGRGFGKLPQRTYWRGAGTEPEQAGNWVEHWDVTRDPLRAYDDTGPELERTWLGGTGLTAGDSTGDPLGTDAVCLPGQSWEKSSCWRVLALLHRRVFVPGCAPRDH
jgi:hypothetical protein